MFVFGRRASSRLRAICKKPHIVFVSGDHEYSSEETFPIIAKELESKYGFKTTVLKSSPDENAEENIPGLGEIGRQPMSPCFSCVGGACLRSNCGTSKLSEIRQTHRRFSYDNARIQLSERPRTGKMECVCGGVFRRPAGLGQWAYALRTFVEHGCFGFLPQQQNIQS